MRILVGTLYSGEHEFEDCVASIRNQSFQEFEHLVIKGLPNVQAHKSLYHSFMKRADDFQIMVKVDADMVLENVDSFSKIARRFRDENELWDLEIAVQDFFTDKLSWGLHAYRNSVTWKLGGDELFPDPHPVPWSNHAYDEKVLAPAATHCKNPSPFQCFHYGIHRGLKITQPGRRQKKNSFVDTYWADMSLIWKRFLETKDLRLGWAVLGAELALKGNFDIKHISYTNRFALNAFERYLRFDASRIQSEIENLRSSNWGFLPGSVRKWLVGT